jgi:hypothetical protein
MKKVTICIQNIFWNLSSSFDVSNEYEENSYYTKYDNLLIYITTQILSPVTIKHPIFNLNEIIFFLDSKRDYDKLKEHLEKITKW